MSKQNRTWRVAVLPEGPILDLCDAGDGKAARKGYECITVQEALTWTSDKPTIPGVYVMFNAGEPRFISINDDGVMVYGWKSSGWVVEHSAGIFLGPLPPTQEGGE